MALTDVEVKKAAPREKDYKLSDAGVCAGLFVLVKATGAKYWRLKYRIAGKEKALPIGVYPTVSLKDARLKAQEAKRLIAKALTQWHSAKPKSVTYSGQVKTLLKRRLMLGLK